MKLSARNQFKGRIKRITHGAVNSEVEIELAPGIVMTAQITTASVHALGLKEGGDAYAIVKADSVMVGVDHWSGRRRGHAMGTLGESLATAWGVIATLDTRLAAIVLLSLRV